MPRYSRTTTNVPAKAPTAAYPKGSPARKIVKTSAESPSFMGFSRSSTSTTVDGTLTSSSSTVKSSGGGGSFLGPALILGGAFLLWIVFRGKSGAMWNAITGDTSFDVNLDKLASAVGPLGSSGGGGGGGGGSRASSNAQDSGSHMGIDANGNIVSIDKPYGSMTGEEKDAANAYAHQIGNVG